MREILFSVGKGSVLPLTLAPDPVFAEKILGDGYMLEPISDTISAPCDCEVISVADTLHAYGLKTPGGAEILVHIGINTVELNGKHFECKVAVGDKLRRGETLCVADFVAIKAKDYKTFVPVVVTTEVRNFRIITGQSDKNTKIAEYDVI